MENKIYDLLNLIRQNKGLVPIINYNPTDRLRDDLGFSSFDLAELTVRIEDEFDIDIFEDGLINTIN